MGAGCSCLRIEEPVSGPNRVGVRSCLGIEELLGDRGVSAVELGEGRGAPIPESVVL